MTDAMDYRQMPTRLQEYLFKRWLKQVKKEGVEFQITAPEKWTMEYHTRLVRFETTEFEGRMIMLLIFEDGQDHYLASNGCNELCNCLGVDEEGGCGCSPLVLYAYRVEGSPEWHDYEDWLIRLVGLDFRDHDEDFIPQEVRRVQAIA